jgi:hypothetical protein
MIDANKEAENIARHLLFTSSLRSTRDRELESLVETVHDTVSQDVFQSIIYIILEDTRPAANRLFPLIMPHKVSVGVPLTTNCQVDGNDVCENILEDSITNVLDNTDTTYSTSRGRHSRLEARVD